MCGASGPGCDRSVLGAVHNPTTPGTPGGGSSNSCGPNGCPTPPPAAPPAPGSPGGPSNAGTGGPGGPGHAGGSGTARLNAAGSTEPTATGPGTSGPKQNALEPNQSANTARGPPPPTTDPNAAPGTPGPARPTTANPNDEGGFFGGIKRVWDSMAGTNVANEPHDGGYIPAHGNTPAQVDEGRANSVDLVEKEADAFSYIPGPAGRESRIAGGAIRGAKELSSEALYSNRVHAPEGPTSIPVTGTSRGEPSAGGGPGRDPVAANPRAGAANPGETSPAVTDPGPGRIINRPSAKPGTRSPMRVTRPGVTRPSGRPDSPAGTGPGSRPGTQSTANPSSPGELAPVNAGGTRPPVSNSGAGRGPGDSGGEPPRGMGGQRPPGPDSVSGGGRGDGTEPTEGLPTGGQPQAHSTPEQNVASGPSSTKPPARDEAGPSGAGPASEEVLQGRDAYNAEIAGLGRTETKMRGEGKSDEQIARALNQQRRDIGERYKHLTPEPLRSQIYARNQAKYNDKLGPTVEWLRERGKSWADIIESSKHTGGGDLGLKNNQ